MFKSDKRVHYCELENILMKHIDTIYGLIEMHVFEIHEFVLINEPIRLSKLVTDLYYYSAILVSNLNRFRSFKGKTILGDLIEVKIHRYGIVYFKINNRIISGDTILI